MMGDKLYLWANALRLHCLLRGKGTNRKPTLFCKAEPSPGGCPISLSGKNPGSIDCCHVFLAGSVLS